MMTKRSSFGRGKEFPPIGSHASEKKITFGQWATLALAVLAPKSILILAKNTAAEKRPALIPGANAGFDSWRFGTWFSCSLTETRVANSILYQNPASIQAPGSNEWRP